MSDGQARGLERGLTEYGDRDFSWFLRRAFLRAAGLDEHLASPVVAIADTSSDYVPCHRQMPELVRAIARGVAAGGALPMVFPTMALGEPLLSPTAMLFRNLAAMALEEQLRSQPLDAVVLVGGCDKTVPAHLMAAASAGVPAVQVVSGPMLAGEWRGRRTGACTDCRAYWAEHRAGVLGADDIASVEGALCPTAGTCMVMGTASTMAILAEALGMSTPGSATAPAPTGERLAHGERAGRLAARLAVDPVRPADVLDRRAFHNALVVLAAIGGSTNAIVHLLAIARRAGVPLSLDDIGAVAREVPVRRRRQAERLGLPGGPAPRRRRARPAARPAPLPGARRAHRRRPHARRDRRRGTAARRLAAGDPRPRRPGRPARRARRRARHPGARRRRA